MKCFASIVLLAVLFTIGHASRSIAAATPPTIADVGTAMLADDRCFDSANRLLALYWSTGVRFYAQQQNDFDPEHPSVVMARINGEAADLEEKAALGFKFAPEADRVAFCAAALEAAKSVPLKRVGDFATASAMPMVPQAAPH